MEVLSVHIEPVDPKDPGFRRLNRHWRLSQIPIIGRFFGWVAIHKK